MPKNIMSTQMETPVVVFSNSSIGRYLQSGQTRSPSIPFQNVDTLQVNGLLTSKSTSIDIEVLQLLPNIHTLIFEDATFDVSEEFLCNSASNTNLELPPPTPLLKTMHLTFFTSKAYLLSVEKCTFFRYLRRFAEIRRLRGYLLISLCLSCVPACLSFDDDIVWLRNLVVEISSTLTVSILIHRIGIYFFI